ncbi:MAG: cob(I)yrinic acid a,c-diamide adenosyltransferase [Treponema sp.]|jgi:cob(I)alamin adenosyltransferase|nr:cob(I)yrinic acid a,c-diamide adenosyltransferase [Treponema sp.]
MAGLLHLYIGDGKGKTTAAVGLSVRARGRDKTVVFAQFLKSGITGELRSLEQLGVRVIRSTVSFGFTYQMDEQTKTVCRNEQHHIMNRIAESLKDESVDLLILDEILDAVNSGMLEEQTFRSFVENRDPALEVALTGRGPGPWLLEIADYVSEIKKIKHPFDKGIQARTGIEK